MEKIFDIDKFNILQDNENYYFIRALNMGDYVDIESGITTSNGQIQRVRTDRERWIENSSNPMPKYNEDSNISLEQMFDHIKMHQRKDTNCISLSSNSCVSITYGRGSYKDKYILVKVPKDKFGDKVKIAGEYFLSEIEKRINDEIEFLSQSEDKDIIKKLQKIDSADTVEKVVDSVFEGYKYDGVEKIYTSKNGKRVSMHNVSGRFSSYQTLDEKQNLEKNKIIAKLTVLECFGHMDKIIPQTFSNSNLIRTIGNAFSSLELINYGEIERESIIEVPSNMIDIFSLLQQIKEKVSDDKVEVVEEIERIIIEYTQKGYNIESSNGQMIFSNGVETIDLNVNSDIYDEDNNIPSIEELYSATSGRMKYIEASDILYRLYHVNISKLKANELADALNVILGDDLRYSEIIELMKKECFIVDPKIISRRGDSGYKISESVSLDFDDDEASIVDEIKAKDNESLIKAISNPIEEILINNISNEKDGIDKNTYYANALIDLYDFDRIGITFTEVQRNLLIKNLKEFNLPKIYKQFQNVGVSDSDIPKFILNICMDKQLKEIVNDEDFENKIKDNLDSLSSELYIEQVEDFLGFYSIEGTNIKLREYQQRATNNIDEIYKEKRFASAILPTGSGKSFVAIAEMLKYGLNAEENRGKILYVAPSNEILNQIREDLIEYVIGTKGTMGKSNEEIIKEAFPNLDLCTYSSLKFRSDKKNKEKYDFIVLDELHRTGAEDWGKNLEKLLKEQDKETKVLGITATPERDVDGKNMAHEIAQKLGYTEEEIKDEKHIAIKMDLIDAIRNGIVINPKLVSCEYNLLSNERFINLLNEINEIEDETIKNEKLARYEELRRSLQNAQGVKEILNEHLKNGGKYIVFIPISDNGEEIEDEYGNKTSSKLSSEEKIKKAQEDFLKNFEEKKVKYYSMLGSYSDKLNLDNLNSFENDDGEEIHLMFVINKLNEGVHVKGINGIIWLRPLDKNSRILCTQQLGRCIYPIDKDNPVSEEDLPVIIDLPNNLLTIDLQKTINTYTTVDDFKLLKDIVDWIGYHNGRLPNIESKGNEEYRKAVILKNIQEKYRRYLDAFDEDIEDDEKERIQKILETGDLIDLWNLELPDKKDKDGKTIKSDKQLSIDAFSLEGKLGRLCKLENEVQTINNVSAARRVLNETKMWLEENFGDDKNPKCQEYKRHMPRHLHNIRAAEKGAEETPEQRERRIAQAISKHIKTIDKKLEKEEITEEEKEILKEILKDYKTLLKSYDISTEKRTYLELKEWLEENFGDDKNPKCKEYERHMPRQLENIRAAEEGAEETPEQKENRIARVINKNIKTIDEKLEKEDKTEEEKEILKEILKDYKTLLKSYDISTEKRTYLELKEWLEENFDKNPKCKEYERHMPRKLENIRAAEEGAEETPEQKERRIAQAVQGHIKTIDKELKKKDKTEEEKEILKEILKDYKTLLKSYDISTEKRTYLELKEWLEENFGDDKKPKCKEYERHMPRFLNIRAAEEGAEETPEQKEMRIAQAVQDNIKTIDKKLKKKDKTEEEKEILKEILKDYKELEEKYMSDKQRKNKDKTAKKKKLTGQDIGKASFDTEVSTSNEADRIVRKEIESLNNDKKVGEMSE